MIEFPAAVGPMARRLLDAKRKGVHADHRRVGFERRLAERFRVERTEALSFGTRVLSLARRRP